MSLSIFGELGAASVRLVTTDLAESTVLEEATSVVTLVSSLPTLSGGRAIGVREAASPSTLFSSSESEDQ